MAETNAKEVLARAAQELRQLKAKVAELEKLRQRAPIAIVGMSGRFPMAHNLGEYWQNLVSGRDCTSEFPTDRAPDLRDLYDPDPERNDRVYTRRGGFLDGITRFDNKFFSITARDATSMDPQQAILLQTAWEAFEDAGMRVEDLKHTRVGVYIGITNSDYGTSLALDDPYFVTGVPFHATIGRISHTFGFRGPCVPVDTACSASLVAVHLASKALQIGEVDVAVAGGVNLLLAGYPFLVMCRAQALARDGRCKTFDASADGYSRGEGCGIVVLRRLADATAARQTPHALILGSAINHNGGAAAMPVPIGAAQEDLMRTAYADAGITPADVGYLEAHGTGTALGDPVEVRAIANVFSGKIPRIGTGKVNIGHLESSAGIAGLLRAVLVLKHGTIPPHLHLTTPNPHIPWDAFQYPLADAPTKWEGDGAKIAAVSSFGISGTNAHVVLQLPPAAASSPAGEPGPALVCLSGKTESAVAAMARRLEAALDARDVPLDDVAYTLGHGRKHWAFRKGIVADSRSSLVEELRRVTTGRRASPPKRIAFVFPGQGSLVAGSGAALHRRFAAFREAFDDCATVAKEWDVDLGRLLLDPEAAKKALGEPRPAQLHLAAVEIGVLALLRSCGVEASIVAGHSLGEYVAAHAAGALSRAEALRLVGKRASLMERVPAGSMLSVRASVATLTPLLAGSGADVSAMNGPEEVVVGGPSDQVRALAEKLEQAGLRTRLLTTTHAFHSAMMDPILEEFEAYARSLKLGAPRGAQLVSTKHGELVDEARPLDARYWRDQLREPVRFDRAALTLIEQKVDAFVEVGPGTALSGILGRGLDAPPPMTPTLGGTDDAVSFLRALGSLFEAGLPVQVPKDRGRITSLPTYPFEPAVSINLKPAKTSLRGQPFLGKPAGGSEYGWLEATPRAEGPAQVFESTWNADEHPLLASHRILDRTIVSGAFAGGFIQRWLFTLPGAPRIVELHFHRPFWMRDGIDYQLRLIAEPKDDGGVFRLVAIDDSGEPAELCSGTFAASPDIPAEPLGHANLEEIRARCTEHLSGAEYYQAMWSEEAQSVGGPLRRVGEYWFRPGEALAEIAPLDESAIPETLRELVTTMIWMEVYGQVGRTASIGRSGKDTLYLFQGSSAGARLPIIEGGKGPAFIHGVMTSSSPAGIVCDVDALDRDGNVLVAMKNLTFARMNNAAFAQLLRDKPTENLGEELKALAPSARTERILELITEGIGQILGTSEGIDPDASLAQLGLDSFALAVIRQRLNDATGAKLSMKDVFENASPGGLARFASGLLGGPDDAPAAPAKPRPVRWLVPLVPCESPHARIVCFPGGGGGPLLFHRLARPLAGLGVEVLAVQLPGREERSAEPPAPLDEVKARILEAIPADEVPLILLGHSMGASLAFTLLPALGKRVVRFIVLMGPPPEKLVTTFEGWGSEPLTRFLEHLTAATGDKDHLEQARGAGEQDLELMKALSQARLEPQAVAAIVAFGKRDELVSEALVGEWKRWLSGPFELRGLPAGHFPMSEAPDAVANLLRALVAFG